MLNRLATATAALAVLGASSVCAQPAPDRQDGTRPPAISREDAGAYLEARIAALHFGLQPTPEQERLWPPFEQAVRELANLRQEGPQEGARQRGGEPPAADDLMARIERRADALIRRGAAFRALAQAAAPLWQSLDDGQKRRFAVLARPSNFRGGFGARDGRGGFGRGFGPGGDGDFGRRRFGFGGPGPGPGRDGDDGSGPRGFGPRGFDRDGEFGSRRFGFGGPRPGRDGERYGFGGPRGFGPRGFGRDGDGYRYGFGPRDFGPREFGRREFGRDGDGYRYGDGRRDFDRREFDRREFDRREFDRRDFGPRDFGRRDLGRRDLGRDGDGYRYGYGPAPREFGPRGFEPRDFGRDGGGYRYDYGPRDYGRGRGRPGDGFRTLDEPEGELGPGEASGADERL
jgi:hypothetical protein